MGFINNDNALLKLFSHFHQKAIPYGIVEDVIIISYNDFCFWRRKQRKLVRAKFFLLAFFYIFLNMAWACSFKLFQGKFCFNSSCSCFFQGVCVELAVFFVTQCPAVLMK